MRRRTRRKKEKRKTAKSKATAGTKRASPQGGVKTWGREEPECIRPPFCSMCLVSLVVLDVRARHIALLVVFQHAHPPAAIVLQDLQPLTLWLQWQRWLGVGVSEGAVARAGTANSTQRFQTAASTTHLMGWHLAIVCAWEWIECSGNRNHLCCGFLLLLLLLRSLLLKGSGTNVCVCVCVCVFLF